MNKILWIKYFFFFVIATIISGFFVFGIVAGQTEVFAQTNTNVSVHEGALGFKIPNMADILTFAVKFFFIPAGLAALGYGLWGAFSWVTSGGEPENVEKARNRIVAAIVGVILVVAILAIMVTFEQFVFQQRVCFGLSCPVVIPGILEACVPNPQYGRTSLPASDWTDIKVEWNGMVVDDSVECCPHGLPPDSPDRSKIRITTGWGAGTKNFGNYDYQICCIYGDYDGNQICDGWDKGIGVYAL